MGTAPRLPDDHSAVADPVRAPKHAVQHTEHDRTEIVEGVVTPVSRTWACESAAGAVRGQLTPCLDALGLVAGSGDLDLPGSENRFVPDLAVVPADLAAKTEGALLPDRTLLVVEVTSPSNGETDRTVKRRRYGQYGAPLYLLVDRQHRACTLFSGPTRLGYAVEDGPHPFGTPVRLPEPFDLDLDTSGL
ncbi:Putative restriction endonuclease [Streptomyces sp. TLI_053]|uniref:Uma2 family endonuclease n=1 Tax=Streptomyces sp. TLI_053 TaxID=1855352 RepID=UPI00087C4D78|nr:Uma2 family endonuclease [Streptomyces sp. TLI_053]SDT25218.1 Putative restriction endonuclease [Streptomyces sp. TLI_053]